MVPSWSAQCQPRPPRQLGPPAPLPAHLPLQWGAAHTPLRLDGHNMATLTSPFIPQCGDKERDAALHDEWGGNMNGRQRLERAYARG